VACILDSNAFMGMRVCADGRRAFCHSILKQQVTEVIAAWPTQGRSD